MYVKDPRVDYSYNAKILDLMQKYFAIRSQQIEQGMDGPEIDIVEHDHRLGLEKPFYDRFDN